MMKRFWTAVLILLLLLSASLWNGWYVNRFGQQAAQQLEQAQEMAKQDRWEQADELTKTVFQQLNAKKFYFHAVMRHQETDEILRTFHQVLQYIALNEMDQYAAANTDLAIQLQLLGEMESAALENVL